MLATLDDLLTAIYVQVDDFRPPGAGLGARLGSATPSSSPLALAQVLRRQAAILESII